MLVQIFLPFALVQLGNAMVSMRRLNQFLVLEERSDTVSPSSYLLVTHEGIVVAARILHQIVILLTAMGLTLEAIKTFVSVVAGGAP